MRAARLAAALALALLPLPALAGGPFEGWSEEQVAEHRRAALQEIGRRLRNWFPSRIQLVVTCRYCEGSGEVYAIRTSRRRSWKEVSRCAHCKGTGSRVSGECWRRLFWDCHSPAVREDPRRKAEMERAFAAAAKSPSEELPVLSRVTRSRRKGVEVYGNFAVVSFLDELSGDERPGTVELIEIDGEWWVAHEESDRDFVRRTYPGVDPPGPPAAGGRNPDDPAGLFEIDRIRTEPAAEGTWKVTGRLRNASLDRRFGWLIVEVSLLRGSTVVAKCRCNAGGAVVGPGEALTFTGYVHADEAPRHSSTEARVVGFEER